MKKLLEATNQYFESSSNRTPEYLAWHRLFKREFKKFLGSFGITEIEISKPNHFDASGFFKLASGKIYYFRIEDLRWSKNKMLIRTAQSFKDYTGGINCFASLENEESFKSEFWVITGIAK